MTSQPGSSARRIRIGLTGLAFAFLFILLGSVISKSSREDEPPANAIENAIAAEPNEPLAELGVAPGAGEAREAEAKAEAVRNAAEDAAAAGDSSPPPAAADAQ